MYSASWGSMPRLKRAHLSNRIARQLSSKRKHGEDSPENWKTNLTAAFAKIRRMVQGYTGQCQSPGGLWNTSSCF